MFTFFVCVAGILVVFGIAFFLEWLYDFIMSWAFEQ